MRMGRSLLLLQLLWWVLIHTSSGEARHNIRGSGGARQIIDINRGWRFLGTEADAPQGDCNVAECKASTDDQTWRDLDLPHDFVVEGTFSRTEGDALHGFLPGSKAWYRHSFSLPAAWEGKRHIVLEFDGVSRNSTYFLNGQLVARHASGYTSFHFRLDDGVLRFGGEENVLAVHVDATQPDGWWYDGGGIYRNVRLVVSDPLHIVPWGVYAPSKVTGPMKRSIHGLVAEAAMKVQVTVENTGPLTRHFTVSAICTHLDGQSISSGDSHDVQTLNPGQTGTYEVVIDMKEAALWSLDHPNLYQVVARITDVEEEETAVVSGSQGGDESVVDEVSVSTGIRTVEFSAVEGLLLNGEHVKVQGMCNHQDFAGLGVAVPDSLQAYRVMRMKDIGANAWRTAHNPPSPALLDWTDRLGMLVWDENHRNRAEGEWFTDLQSMVLRDRNHPSIIIWSLCNEALCEGWNLTSAAILKAEIERLDPDGGRYVSAAMNEGYDTGFNLLLDLMGFNYHVGLYDDYHATHPEQPIIGSETSSAYSDRGLYEKDPANAHLDAYDTNYPPWGNSAEDAWCPTGGRPWIAGGFVWTGFDYKGEPTPYGWPSINSHFGVLDIAGFGKDNEYYYKSVWSSEPMVHLLPHWNWNETIGIMAQDGGDDSSTSSTSALLRGEKGVRRRNPLWVWVYTNQAEVELLLNGRSLGRQAMPREQDTGYSCRHLEWQVDYEPGMLEARAYASGPGDSSSYVSDVVVTTGPAHQLAVDMDWPREGSTEGLIAGQMALLVVSVTDGHATRRVVPTGSFNVTITVQGAGRIVGLGNGDPSSLEPDKPYSTRLASRTTFGGLARVIVQAGTVTIIAASPDLVPAAFALSCRGSGEKHEKVLVSGEGPGAILEAEQR